MNKRIPYSGLLLILTLALVLIPYGTVRAEFKSTAEEDQLTQEELGINKESDPKDASRIHALAKQYDVDPSVVQDLHNKQPGWGGLSIRLSLAQNLMRKDPVTYPTMNDAITKVEALRAEGKGYGVIAKDLGFKLGPVVSDAKHTRNDLRRQGGPVDTPPHPEKHIPIEKAPHPDKPPHPEKPAHPEKMHKPEKPPKP